MAGYLVHHRARPADTPDISKDDWFNIFVLHQNRVAHTQVTNAPCCWAAVVLHWCCRACCVLGRNRVAHTQVTNAPGCWATLRCTGAAARAVCCTRTAWRTRKWARLILCFPRAVMGRFA